jgi:radical SAM protein with 4Fe4S-binding SPASM domain
MIATICRVKWESHDHRYRVLAPLTELPTELEYLSRPAYRAKLANIESCPCCLGDAVSLRVSWVYQDPHIILLDGRVTYCLNTNRLLVNESEKNSLSARQQQVLDSSLIPVTPRLVGVGGKITRPLMNRTAQESLGIKSRDTLFISADSQTIAYKLPLKKEARGFPYAIGFHSTARPEQTTLTIEATTKCNFRCGFCYGRHIDQGSLSLKDFLVILDRLPCLQAVEFTGEGEPLVNRDLFEMVKICVDRGIWTHVTSNGSFLNRESCKRLLSVAPSSIAISLESLDPVRFARLRPGGNLSTVLDAISTIADLRRQQEQSVQLRLWVTILRETLMEVNRIDDFARSVGADLVEFQVLNPMDAYSRFYSKELAENMLTLQEMEELIANPKTPPALRSALSSVTSVYRGRTCDIFMSSVMTYWQGNVTPCRLLKTPQFQAYGNLRQESFDEIWDREEYRFFRFALQHGVVLKSCKGCPSIASA